MISLIGVKIINKDCSLKAVLLVSVILILSAPKAHALKFNFGVSQSYEDISNAAHASEADVALAADDFFRDTLVISSLFLKFKEESSILKSTVDFKVNYLDYVNDVASDLTRNNLKSSFLWEITPGYYSWYLVENIVQSQIDVSLVVSEENTQDVNEFLTGPRFNWQLGSSTLKLNSYINNYTYSSTDNDSTNLVTELIWRNELASGVKLDMKYATRYVSFDRDQIYDSYDQSTIGAGLKYKKNTNNIDIFLGKTFLNSENVDDSVFEDERIKLTRDLTRYSSLGLLYSNGLSSRDESLSAGGTVLNGVFISKETVLTYKRSSHVFGLEVKITQSERNNVDTATTNDERADEITFYRILASRSKLDFTFGEVTNTVQVGTENYIDKTYVKKIRYIKRFNNKLSFSAHVSELYVVSDDPNRQFNDKRIGITISIER